MHENQVGLLDEWIAGLMLAFHQSITPAIQ
jgi:hypothetical protein